MAPEPLHTLAKQLLAGEYDAEEFVKLVAGATSEAEGVPAAATVDVDRAARCGFPEVIFGEGKSPLIIAAIAGQLLERQQRVLATRIDAAKAVALQELLPGARYNATARTLRLDPQDADESDSTPELGRVAVITAGTSDLPVAEEARETLDWMGVDVAMVQDVGVAGPHRLPARLAEFVDCDAVVVVAGMEGALPSVVGGYVPCPVFAVPTSVGYGANLGGIAALLSMLNSCAANVAVVNIDAGFKAGYVAGLVATRAASGRSHVQMEKA
jgi:pyridinium-3,5-biscarboxylic acid mononucleotide synthase